MYRYNTFPSRSFISLTEVKYINNIKDINNFYVLGETVDLEFYKKDFYSRYISEQNVTVYAHGAEFLGKDVFEKSDKEITQLKLLIYNRKLKDWVYREYQKDNKMLYQTNIVKSVMDLKFNELASLRFNSNNGLVVISDDDIKFITESDKSLITLIAYYSDIHGIDFQDLALESMSSEYLTVLDGYFYQKYTVSEESPQLVGKFYSGSCKIFGPFSALCPLNEDIKTDKLDKLVKLKASTLSKRKFLDDIASLYDINLEDETVYGYFKKENFGGTLYDKSGNEISDVISFIAYAKCTLKVFIKRFSGTAEEQTFVLEHIKDSMLQLFDVKNVEVRWEEKNATM